MKLFRVFDWDRKSIDASVGGPLYVPRMKQGAGRFDIPDLDGILYGSLSEVGAITEWLQAFRTQRLPGRLFERPDGLVRSLVQFKCPDERELADLDNAKTLVALDLRPSEVLTHDRKVTRRLARRLFDEGYAGILWPSTLEGSWKNASLFESQITGGTHVEGNITPLSFEMPAVKSAMDWLQLKRPTRRVPQSKARLRKARKK